MSERIVTTQAQLDKALADEVDWIEIRSPKGVWLTVTASGSSTVTASPKTAVHLHSGYAKVKGGVLIDHTADLSNPADWCKAPDWTPDNECGGGLHFSPSPMQALAYHSSATKFVAVGVRVADLRPIPGGTAKAKAPAVVRACREVDIDGEPVERAGAVA